MTESGSRDGADFRAGVGRDNTGSIVNVGSGGSTGDIAGTIVQGNVVVIQLPSQDGPLLRDAPTSAPPSAPVPGVENVEVDTSPYTEVVNQALAGVRAAEETGLAVENVQVGDIQVSKIDLLLKRAVIAKAEASHMMIENVTAKQQELQQFATQFQAAGRFDQESLDRFAADGQAIIWRGFDRDTYSARLEDARALFEEALDLDETNVEALLQLADLHMALTPHDVSDEERILVRANALLQHPTTDDERFMQAQAMLMSAMIMRVKHGNMTPGPELLAVARQYQSVLTEARDQFSRLGRTMWANAANEMLESSRANVASWAGPQPPLHGAGGSEPSTSPSGTPQQGWGQPFAPPSGHGFDPVGHWNVEIVMGMIPTGSAYLALNPDHSLQGMVSPDGSALYGQWNFLPAMNQLLVQGHVNGMQPFYWQVQLVNAQYATADGFDHIGNSYRFYRTG